MRYVALGVALALACGPGGTAPNGRSDTPPAAAPAAPDGGTPAGDGAGAQAGGGEGAASPGSGGATGGGGSATPTNGGGATTPDAACAALLATAGAAVEVAPDTGGASMCSMATSSPDGQIVLALGDTHHAVATQLMTLYSAIGERQGEVMAVQGLTTAQDIDPWFHWTSRGYQGIVHDASLSPALVLRTWDRLGAVVRSGTSVAVTSAPDGKGGSVVITQWPSPSMDLSTTLQWADASGAVTRTIPLDRPSQHVLVGWGTGHVLVISESASAAARWFDAEGAPLTPWFDLPAPSGYGVTMHLLLDGSVALSNGGLWRVVLQDGIARADSAPAWLANRPNTRLATIRGGRGYAVVPFTWAGSDFSRIEVLTASGESCGAIALPPVTPPPGVAAHPRRLDIGQDGTVLQAVDLADATAPASVKGCVFRWWPGLVR